MELIEIATPIGRLFNVKNCELLWDNLHRTTAYRSGATINYESTPTCPETPVFQLKRTPPRTPKNASRYCKGRIYHVVAYNVSRISRDMTSFLNDIGFILAKCGVTLRSTQEVIDESPTGRFMLNIALSVHQLDNDIKSKTVKDDVSLLASYGWWLSQAPPKTQTDRNQRIH